MCPYARNTGATCAAVLLRVYLIMRDVFTRWRRESCQRVVISRGFAGSIDNGLRKKRPTDPRELPTFTTVFRLYSNESEYEFAHGAWMLIATCQAIAHGLHTAWIRHSVARELLTRQARRCRAIAARNMQFVAWDGCRRAYVIRKRRDGGRNELTRPLTTVVPRQVISDIARRKGESRWRKKWRNGTVTGLLWLVNSATISMRWLS